MATASEGLVDVTQWLKQAAGGQMIKRPDLRLLDAMNSIEILDPRMDTGIKPASKRDFIFDPQMSMEPEELCWVMDEMLAMEVAWYQGANLAQTVFACLYYLHPDRIDGPNTSLLMSLVFKAFLLGYCKSIDLAYKELSKGHLHDVEDCWLDHYGLPVHLEDEAESILGLLDHALRWLDGFDHPYRSALQARIKLRIEYLALLDVLPATPSWNPEYITQPPEPTTPPSSPVFDNVMPYLRQTMPPSDVTIPSHEDAWSEMTAMMSSLHALRDVGSDLLTWEIFTRARAWRRKDLNVVRSLYKTFFDERIQNLTGRYVSLISELPENFLTILDSQISTADRQQFAIWRDIVGGLLITTLSTPTLNRARQRRSYQSLSFSWRERAAMAERLGLGQISQVMHAIRLDCLLEGALAAFDADLISMYEEQQAWWWIGCVARSRLELGLKRSWQTVWAEMWAQIARTMVMLLQLYPRRGPDTKERFALRHKWAIKLPILPDGSKVETGLSPVYEDWMRDRDVQLEPDERRIQAEQSCTAALETMKRLLDMDLGKDPRDFIATMSELRQDICHNLNAKSGKWGTRRRWILLLQT